MWPRIKPVATSKEGLEKKYAAEPKNFWYGKIMRMEVSLSCFYSQLITDQIQLHKTKKKTN